MTEPKELEETAFMPSELDPTKPFYIHIAGCMDAQTFDWYTEEPVPVGTMKKAIRNAVNAAGTGLISVVYECRPVRRVNIGKPRVEKV